MAKYVTNDILINLLAAYNIKHLVLSSGARNIPFVNAVENNKNFTCYSVVDERNAAFFALGLSQRLNKPVAIACTSGTAVSNYLSGVTEAFYSHAPLVVITFDRNPYALNQLETQKIDQPAIFKSVVKKTVSLPLIKDEDDSWYCQRLINEALIALTQHQDGPVHINVPLVGDQNRLVSETIHQDTVNNVHKIDYISVLDEEGLKQYAANLANKKILLVMGQQSYIDEKTKQAIHSFCQTYHVPVLADNLANYHGENVILAEGTIKALNTKTIQKYLPNILISFGNNFQERIKDLFREHRKHFSHWSIEPEGVIKDVFKNQRALFEMLPVHFFEKLVTYAPVHLPSEHYLKMWKTLEKALVLPDMPFTNFYIVKEFSKLIPRGSLVHTAILNSTRLMQFFKLDASITSFSNVNAFGIDGCLPTFMGQASATDQLSFLVIGDLSFFYGMNAIAIKHRKNNIRILVLNNGGGAEFHIMPNSNAIPTIDKHIGCAHSRSAKDWVLSMGYEYLSAHTKEELEKVLPLFVSSEHNKPVVLETFTDMKRDGEFTLSVYRALEKSIQDVIKD